MIPPRAGGFRGAGSRGEPPFAPAPGFTRPALGPLSLDEACARIRRRWRPSRDGVRRRDRRVALRKRIALAGSLVLLAPSCGVLKAVAKVPGRLFGGSSESGVRPVVVQNHVTRFVDSFIAGVAEATEGISRNVGTPEARIQALTWSVTQTTAALSIASGMNPASNLLDLIVLVTLGRMAYEEHGMPGLPGEAGQPITEAYRKMEEEAWVVAREVFTPKQEEEVRRALLAWREKNPGVELTAFVRLPRFQSILKSMKKEDSPDAIDDLFNLVSFDPLANLDPATREVEQARLFVERALFHVQRAPLVYANQAELLGLKLSRLEEVHAAVEATDRISRASASLAETAASLPARISEELESASAPTREILGEARTTLETGAQTAAALEAAIRALDAFLVGIAARSDRAESRPGEKRGRPFDVTDYGEAAARIGSAAGELNRLITTLDQSLTEVERMVDEVADRGDRTVDRALNRGLLYGVLLIAVGAIAVIAVRALSRRGSGPPTSRSSA